MEDFPFESDAEKPRYVLPEGCRDLLDWILRQEAAARNNEQPPKSPTLTFEEIVLPMPGAPRRISKQSQQHALPAKVWLPQPVQVDTLASKLGLKFYHIIGALIRRKIFVTAQGWINFTTAAAICAELGVVAEKEDSGSLPL